MAALAVPTLRTSERATFKRCAWKWLQEFRYGYRPSESGRMRSGSASVQALAPAGLRGRGAVLHRYLALLGWR